MRTAVKFLLIAGIVGAGVALYWYLTRRRTDENEVAEPSTIKGNEWILSDALQASQLSSLSAQLSEKPSKDDVLSLLSSMISPAVDAYTKAQADDRYMAKIAGKGLSTNDYTDDHRTKLLGLIPHQEVATYADLAGVSVPGKPVLITCLTDATYGETESLYYKTSTKLRKVALIDEN